MKYVKTGLAVFIFLLGGIVCGFSKDKEERDGNRLSLDTAGLTYANPVFQPVLADPTVMKSGGSFYPYDTDDSWGANYRLASFNTQTKRAGL